MANRLSENPKWKVLLLEVGDEETNFLTEVPLTAAITILTSMLIGQLFDLENKYELTHCIVLQDIIGAIEQSERKTLVCI